MVAADRRVLLFQTAQFPASARRSSSLEASLASQRGPRGIGPVLSQPAFADPTEIGVSISQPSAHHSGCDKAESEDDQGGKNQHV